MGEKNSECFTLPFKPSQIVLTRMVRPFSFQITAVILTQQTDFNTLKKGHMILSHGEWKQHTMEQTLLQPAKTTGSHNNDQNLPSITAGNKWPGPNVTSVL